MIENSLIEYISQCYRNILHREPDEAGLSHYLKEITEGRLAKEDLTSIFKSSDEYLVLNQQYSSPDISKKVMDVTNLDESLLVSKVNEINITLLHDFLINNTIIPG